MRLGDTERKLYFYACISFVYLMSTIKMLNYFA